MVGHQTIGDDCNSRGSSVFLEQAQEIAVIFLFEEDRLASTAAVVDVIELTFDKGCYSVRHDSPEVCARHLLLDFRRRILSS